MNEQFETVRAALSHNCTRCLGAGHVLVKHGTTFDTDSAAERAEAWHKEPCPICQVPALAALAKIEAEHARVTKALQVASDALFATEHALDELADIRSGGLSAAESCCGDFKTHQAAEIARLTQELADCQLESIPSRRHSDVSWRRQNDALRARVGFLEGAIATMGGLANEPEARRSIARAAAPEPKVPVQPPLPTLAEVRSVLEPFGKYAEMLTDDAEYTRIGYYESSPRVRDCRAAAALLARIPEDK